MCSQYLSRASAIVAFIGKIFPKEKPSKFLPVLFNFLWMVRPLIPSVYVHIVITIPLVVVQSYYLISHIDNDFFISYLSFYLIEILITTLDFVIVLGEKIFDEHCNAVKTLLTSISPENENLKNKLTQCMLRDAVQKVYVWVISMVILIFQPFLMNYHHWIVQTEQNVSILSTLRPVFGDAILKMWPYFACWCLSNIMLLYIVASIYFIYFIFQNQMALLILTDHVMQFRKKCNKEDQRILNHFWNFRQRADMMKYEKDIMEFLKGIAIMYVEIQRANNRIVNSNQLIQFLFVSSGMLMSIQSILMILSPYERTILMGLSNFVAFLFVGYILMDTVEDYNYFKDMFFTAYSDLNWYNWNVKCQKMYLIGTIYFSKGFAVILFLWVDINRQLLQKILRTLYPVANLFYSSRNTGV